MVRKAWETKGTTTAVARRGAAARPVHVPRTGFLSGRKLPPGASTALAGQATAEYPPAPAAYPGAHGVGHGAGGGYGHPLPPLPVLHQRPGAPAPVPGLPAGAMVVHGVVVEQGWDEGAAVRVSRAVRRWVWRHRFALTPAYAGTAVLIAGTAAPAAATGVLAAVAGASYAAGRWAPRTVAGRAWLSARERMIAAAWCAGGAAWAGVQATGWVHPGRGAAAALVAVTGPQAILWARSRWVRPAVAADVQDEASMEQKAVELIAAWPVHIAPTGPSGLHGSQIDPATMGVPAPGTLVFEVVLGHGVHSQTLTGETVRQHIEAVMDLPVDCVKVDLDRQISTRVVVTMTPGRDLEKNDAVWAGPRVVDGCVPIGLTPGRSEVSLPLFSDTGIFHWIIIGTSGGGKSRLAALLLTAGPVAGVEVILYMDGKGGCSAPDAARALDYVASSAEEYGPTVEMFGRILAARIKRYGDAGISEFDVTREPIICLYIDEAAFVNLTRAQVEIVVQGLDQGRSVGCRVCQVVQKPGVDNYIGGTDAKQGLMGQIGCTLAMRPGTATGGSSSLTATAEDIDLRKLPPGQGWACVLQGGTVLGMPVRMYHAKPELVIDALKDFTPRSLTGPDAEAAGELYANRTTGAMWAERMDHNKALFAAGKPTLSVAQWKARQGQPAGPSVQDDVPTTTTSGPVHPLAAAQRSAAAARLAAPHLHVAAPDDVADQGDELQDGALTIGPPAFVPAQLSGSQATAQATATANRAAVLEVVRSAGGESVSPAQVVAATGLSATSVKRALRALREAGDVASAGVGRWIDVA